MTHADVVGRIKAELARCEAVPPGPWTVVDGVCKHDHPDTSADVRAVDGSFVADCGCADTAKVNARLIASSRVGYPAALWVMLETAEAHAPCFAAGQCYMRRAAFSPSICSEAARVKAFAATLPPVEDPCGLPASAHPAPAPAPAQDKLGEIAEEAVAAWWLVHLMNTGYSESNRKRLHEAIRAALERVVRECAREIRAGCGACGGSGGIETTRAAHDPNCDGSCRNCPVPVRELEQCEYCGRPTAAILRHFGLDPEEGR